MARLTDYVVFNDRKLAARYADRPIPMSTLYEAYFDGDIDIPGDLPAFLKQRNLFVKYTLTPAHLKWAVTNFVPEVTIHSKSQDQRIVREHFRRAQHETPALDIVVLARSGAAGAASSELRGSLESLWRKMIARCRS